MLHRMQKHGNDAINHVTARGGLQGQQTENNGLQVWDLDLSVPMTKQLNAC